MFDARCAIVYAPRARGRKFLMIDEKNGEKFGGMENNTYLCRGINKERNNMNVIMPLENIYNMLSSLSVGNKKWLADHLYADIKQSQDARTKEQLALDMEMSLLEAKAFKDGQKTLKSVDTLIDEL